MAGLFRPMLGAPMPWSCMWSHPSLKHSLVHLPVLEKLVRDLTQLLKKSSRSLRLAALRTLKVCVGK